MLSLHPCPCPGSAPHHRTGEAAAIPHPKQSQYQHSWEGTFQICAAPPFHSHRGNHSILTKSQLQEDTKAQSFPVASIPRQNTTFHSRYRSRKAKKKSWQGAWGWLCPRAAAVSCGSHASHTFKGTPTQLMDVSQPTVCVLTQPLCQGKTTVSVCGCVYIQRL